MMEVIACMISGTLTVIHQRNKMIIFWKEKTHFLFTITGTINLLKPSCLLLVFVLGVGYCFGRQLLDIDTDMLDVTNI